MKKGACRLNTGLPPVIKSKSELLRFFNLQFYPVCRLRDNDI